MKSYQEYHRNKIPEKSQVKNTGEWTDKSLLCFLFFSYFLHIHCVLLQEKDIELDGSMAWHGKVMFIWTLLC